MGFYSFFLLCIKNAKANPTGFARGKNWGGTAALINGCASFFNLRQLRGVECGAPYRAWLIAVHRTALSLMRRDCSLPQPANGCPPSQFLGPSAGRFIQSLAMEISESKNIFLLLPAQRGPGTGTGRQPMVGCGNE